MSNNEQESAQGKRKRSRIDINLSVIVNCGEEEIQTQTQNISLKGILCFPLPSIKPGETCDVLIWLTDTEKIEVQGYVARSGNDGPAIDFHKMSVESFSHLYNLVRLNSRDPDKLDREFQYPAFVK